MERGDQFSYPPHTHSTVLETRLIHQINIPNHQTEAQHYHPPAPEHDITNSDDFDDSEGDGGESAAGAEAGEGVEGERGGDVVEDGLGLVTVEGVGVGLEVGGDGEMMCVHHSWFEALSIVDNWFEPQKHHEQVMLKSCTGAPRPNVVWTPKLMGNHQKSSLQVCEPTKKRFHQESTKRGLREQGSSHICTREGHPGVLSTTFEPRLHVAQTWSSPSHKSSHQAPQATQ
ncbi:hypothetical protein PIB30_061742 [Stylosanthes scabra]|uniref:Uncharacterized protein n=1 Tax=Stylosanthes scabra TaxID=79078 RepID=A0ABU6QLD9_9FABA|nr:hypothetical protein [Stylosanthes scabra]